MAEGQKKILFCEDDEFLVEVYKNKFKMAGYEVESISDFSKIVETVEKFMPDLIFFDIMYDGVSAFEVMKQITSGEATKHIPLVALTNLRKEEDRKRAMESGAKDYLSKPETSLERMMAVAEALIGK